MASKTVYTQSEASTEQFGKKLAQTVISGGFKTFLVLLEGELGAGKTVLTKGIALGLGSTQITQSPTFVFLAVHSGGVMPLYHFDLYRIKDPSEVDELGFFEFLTREGVLVVEWGERVEDFLDYDLKINFKITSHKARELRMEFCNHQLEEIYERTNL
ncbi:MAG: tRNA (adenosine(37)-N6)-threonylcarbamoyltransferase complex ATPase subunit type 1 TsaE [Caldisericaceae bacterium]